MAGSRPPRIPRRGDRARAVARGQNPIAAPIIALSIALALAISGLGPARAAEAADTSAPESLIVPLVVGPLLAPRGGVLGLPISVRLDADDRDPTGEDDAFTPRTASPGSAVFLQRLPDRATVQLADGRELEGLVAVLAPPTVTDLRSLREAAWPGGWTRRPGSASVLSPSEARRRGRPGPALLLIRTPADAEGPIRVAGRSIDVRWRALDAPYTGVPLPGEDRPRLTRESRPDRPDADDPLSWWRWVLLADELGWRPPPPPGDDERTRRVAEHFAARWRMALGRLGERHAGVASTLRDAVTVVVKASSPAAAGDPAARPLGPPPAALPPAIAAWRTNADDLERTVSRLLDVDRPVVRTAAEVVVWADALDPVLSWAEAPDPGAGDWVTVHLANRAIRPETVRIAWAGTSIGAREVLLPPRSLCRVEMHRPAATDAGGGPGSDGTNVSGGSAESARAVDMSPGTASAPGTSAAAARADANILIVTDRRSRSRRIASAPVPIVVRPPGIDLAPSPRITLAAVERGSIDDAATMGGLAMSARVRRRGGQWEVFVECRRPAGTEDDAIEVRLGPAGGGRILHIPENGAIRWWIATPGNPRTDAAAGAASDRTANWLNAPDPAPEVARRSWDDRWYARIVIPPAWISEGMLDLACRRLLDHGLEADITAPGPVPAWGLDPGRLRLDLRRWDE